MKRKTEELICLDIYFIYNCTVRVCQEQAESSACLAGTLWIVPVAVKILIEAQTDSPEACVKEKWNQGICQ